jgi:hypothetical protein
MLEARVSSGMTKHSMSGAKTPTYRCRISPKMVCDVISGSTVSLANSAGADLRNYRVDFSKLTGTFPDLRLRWSVQDGIDQFVGACSGRP